MKLLRIESPYFVAGAEWTRTAEGWRCTRAAPIIGWMVGKDAKEVRRYLERKRWRWAWV